MKVKRCWFCYEIVEKPYLMVCDKCLKEKKLEPNVEHIVSDDE